MKNNDTDLVDITIQNELKYLCVLKIRVIFLRSRSGMKKEEKRTVLSSSFLMIGENGEFGEILNMFRYFSIFFRPCLQKDSMELLDT